jgi:alpha-D-ribose 1-methylphosphonate 5-triphosphate synthase subunit PhnH
MTDLLPGFADPVEAAQASFRAVLDAMARPGSLHQAGAALLPPAPLSPAAGALLLTLADSDTPVFLAPAFAAAADWLRFHCGAELVDDPAAARFVVADAMPELASLDSGTDEGPEDSATLILQVAALGEGTTLTLAGPGLRVPAALHVTGLPDGFPARWAANHALFPRGIDMILTAGTVLTALPRSVRVV